MHISQLEGLRVALWGWGREGRAAYAALRAVAQRATVQRAVAQPAADDGQPGARFPAGLTLFCPPAEAAHARALGDPWLQIETDATGERLAAFDVVVKSPGISPYSAAAQAAVAQGTRFIGGTTLWFAGHADARSVSITGTKGKSTTTALLAHLLRAGGHRTALAGNIGLPLLEVPDDPAPAFWAIELSSYQTVDVAAGDARPDVAVVLNLFPEHLDWHGSQERYMADKLSLVTAARPRTVVLNAADPRLAALQLPHSRIVRFNDAQGWHLRGTWLYRGAAQVMDTADVPLPGQHNRANLCAALAAIEALGLDAAALAPAARSFRPLPHRLQWLGERDGVAWVNDSISTTPHASLAALDCHRGQRTAILLGGHDRGLDWSDFATQLRNRGADEGPAVVVTMAANGPLIHDALAPLAAAGRFTLVAAADLADAVARARTLLDGQGVVLLSPGAPSFGAYRDYTERGRHFAALAGFDPEAISAIAGIGVA